MNQRDDRAAVFGRRWIAANIDPGPHSINDGPIREASIDQFVKEAQKDGLSQEQLERSLGNLRVFLQNAFDDARRARLAEFRP